MSNPTIAIIGGSGIEDFLSERWIDIKIHASYKSHSKKINKTFVGKEMNVNGIPVLFVNRYNVGSEKNGTGQCKEKYKPHEIDYKTLMVGLYQFGIKKIISASKSGSLQSEWGPGSIVLLRDCIDMIHRDITLDDIGSDVADMTFPFDPHICEAIKKSAEEEKIELGADAVYVLAVNGSIFETPSEIILIRNMFSGKLVVGMVAPTEAQLAKLLCMKYAAVSIVTNYASGMRKEEVSKSTMEGNFEKAIPKLTKLLLATVTNLSTKS